MSNENPTPGSISWHDLTVPNADEVRDFYREVVGWQVQDISMGDYNDYAMTHPETGDGVAGVCHARGSNANIPPQWLVYIIVKDLDASLAACTANGGSVVTPKRNVGSSLMAIIRDPAGAVCALYQP